MKMSVGQLICLVVGVFLLSLGSGLAGGRWAVQRMNLSLQQPSQAEEIPDNPRSTEPSAEAPSSSEPRVGSGETSTLPSITTGQNLPAQPSDMSAGDTVNGGTAGESEEKPPGASLRYVVQAVSTPSRNDASTARRKIMVAGYPAGIFEVDLGERGKWYRVYIGPYDSEAEAQQVLELVRQIPGFTSSFVKPLE
jgi:cell division protein FtsN